MPYSSNKVNTNMAAELVTCLWVLSVMLMIIISLFIASIPNLQSMISICEKFGNEFNIQFNSEKTVFVAVSAN